MPLILEISFFLIFLVFLQFVINSGNAKSKRDSRTEKLGFKKALKIVIRFFIFSSLALIVIYFGLSLFHKFSGFDYFLFVEPISLLLPAFLLGIFCMNLNLGIDKAEEDREGKGHNKLRIVKLILSLLLALILLFVQANHFLRMDDRQLYFKNGNQSTLSYSIHNIKGIEEMENGHFVIQFEDAEIKTDKLGGDIAGFIEDLKSKKTSLEE